MPSVSASLSLPQALRPFGLPLAALCALLRSDPSFLVQLLASGDGLATDTQCHAEEEGALTRLVSRGLFGSLWHAEDLDGAGAFCVALLDARLDALAAEGGSRGAEGGDLGVACDPTRSYVGRIITALLSTAPHGVGWLRAIALGALGEAVQPIATRDAGAQLQPPPPPPPQEQQLAAARFNALAESTDDDGTRADATANACAHVAAALCAHAPAIPALPRRLLASAAALGARAGGERGGAVLCAQLLVDCLIAPAIAAPEAYGLVCDAARARGSAPASSAAADRPDRPRWLLGGKGSAAALLAIAEALRVLFAHAGRCVSHDGVSHDGASGDPAAGARTSAGRSSMGEGAELDTDAAVDAVAAALTVARPRAAELLSLIHI